MKRLALIALLGLAGCSTISEAFSDYPRQVAILEASLATAEHSALVYVNLPVCGKTTATICRTSDVTKKIGAYDQAAFTAVQAARVAEDESSIAAAQTAIAALKQVTDTLPGSAP